MRGPTPLNKPLGYQTHCINFCWVHVHVYVCVPASVRVLLRVHVLVSARIHDLIPVPAPVRFGVCGHVPVRVLVTVLVSQSLCVSPYVALSSLFPCPLSLSCPCHCQCPCP
jgi:hypothetical protein